MYLYLCVYLYFWKTRMVVVGSVDSLIRIANRGVCPATTLRANSSFHLSADAIDQSGDGHFLELEYFQEYISVYIYGFSSECWFLRCLVRQGVPNMGLNSLIWSNQDKLNNSTVSGVLKQRREKGNIIFFEEPEMIEAKLQTSSSETLVLWQSYRNWSGI